MDIAAELGGQLGGSWWLGMAMHIVMGVVVIPLLVANVLSKILPAPSIVIGLLTGLALWLLAMTVMMPMMGKGLFLTETGEGPKAIMASFMAHAAYGALLGKIAAFNKTGTTAEVS